MVAPQAHLFSINTLADLTGLHRQTVTKRLANIAPSGMRSGHPVYHLSVAGPALWTGEVQALPNKPQMSPADKKHLVQAQREALKLKTETGKLLDVEAVRRERAKTTLQVINMLNALPDIIDRAARLSPDQSKAVVAAIDEQRAGLHQLITHGK